MDDTIEFNKKGLDQLVKAFKDLPVAKVGILTKDARAGNGSNASIGAKHEFGLDGMPVRSFLRMPIAENMQKYLDSSGSFDEETLKKVIKQGTILEWMKKIGVLAEQIVADGFASGGFGKWKPSNMTHKKVLQTLVETQQLRNSITSEVK